MILTWENEFGTAPRANAGRPLTRSLDFSEEGLAMQATGKCSVAECDKPRKAKGFCSGHHSRWRNHGDPLAGRLQAGSSTTGCSVVDCGEVVVARGWCNLHYSRWVRHGDPAVTVANPGAKCSIDGCERPSRSRTWCKLHYARWRHAGDPMVVRPNVLTPPGPAHPSWRGPDITYASAHRRITNAKGPAGQHSCVTCGRPAAEWSYDHRDPDEIIRPGRRASPFSVKPEHYEPRCVRCHRRFDKGLDV
jgi:hypothetical protein